MKLVSFILVFSALFSLSAETPDYHINNAYNALKNRDFEQAKDHLKHALEEDPNNAKALELKGRIAFAEGNKEDAISHLTKSLESNPDANIYFDRGVAHLSKGNAEQASKDMRKAFEMNPGLHRRLQEATPKAHKKVIHKAKKHGNVEKLHKKLGLQPISMKKGNVKLKKGIIAFRAKNAKK